MPITDDFGKFFNFQMTDKLLAFLIEHRIRTSAKGRPRFKVGEVLQAAADTRLHAYSMQLAGPHLLRIGAFSYSMSPLSVRVRIGRYCSIGPNVRLMGARHQMEAVTNSAIVYRSKRGIFVETFADFGITDWPFPGNGAPEETVIGDDVWIGQDVLLRQGITIGTGAVVGAAAVVLKDVAPYEVVAGVPARRLRWRFKQRVIAALKRTEWWRYAIPRHPELPWTSPEAFLEAFDEAVAAGRMAPFESDLGLLREIVRRTD